MHAQDDFPLMISDVYDIDGRKLENAISDSDDIDDDHDGVLPHRDHLKVHSCWISAICLQVQSRQVCSGEEGSKHC